MRKALVLLAACAALAAAVFYGLRATLDAMRPRGGVWNEAWRVLYGAPATTQRTLIALSVLLILLAFAVTPLALVERRSRRAYERKVEEMKAQRPLDVVMAYVGPEGEGVAFDGAEGRVLVLQGAQGVGAPVVVREKPSPEADGRKAQYPSPD